MVRKEYKQVSYQNLNFWNLLRSFIDFLNFFIKVCLKIKLLMLLNVKALTILHSEWPKLYGVLAILSAIGLKVKLSYIIETLRESKPEPHKSKYLISKLNNQTSNCTKLTLAVCEGF